MNSQIIIETERTTMQHLMVDFAENFFQLNLDPEVIKYTGDKPFDTVDEAKIFLQNYDQYSRYKVGRLAVIKKKSSKFIGWCGIRYDSEKNEYDLGFRFFRDYWNQGYATETALKCIEYGFRDLHLPAIVGRAMKENIASVNVLRKIGMILRESADCGGQAGVVYEITKEQYESK